MFKKILSATVVLLTTGLITSASAQNKPEKPKNQKEITTEQSSNQKEMSNKELVKKAIIEIFVNKDTTAVDRYFDRDYIQHNPRIPNGTEGLKAIVKSLKTEIKYEPSLIVEEGEFVMIHGRYEGWGPKPVIAVDIFRVKNGKLVEHWDVLQEEVPADKSANGNPMFPIK